MLNGKRIIVVLPAYNAELTLRRTYEEIPKDIVDDIILVDDASHDRTVDIAKQLGIFHVIHPKNQGYGGNQKTCYRVALERGADIVIMIHPDYQYTPKLIPAMAGMIASGVYDAAIASRILGGKALRGGMPLYKYVSNRFLTFLQNLLMSQKFSEFHTGYRAFSRKVLEALPLASNSNDFHFDSQMLTQILYLNFRLGEISCPTRYAADASSINFTRSLKYGLCVVWDALQYRLSRWGLIRAKIFHRSSTALLSLTPNLSSGLEMREENP